MYPAAAVCGGRIHLGPGELGCPGDEERAVSIDQVPAERLIPLSEITPRCAQCGSSDAPLRPGEPQRLGDGVVRDTVVCTRHLEN